MIIDNFIYRVSIEAAGNELTTLMNKFNLDFNKDCLLCDYTINISLCIVFLMKLPIAIAFHGAN